VVLKRIMKIALFRDTYGNYKKNHDSDYSAIMKIVDELSEWFSDHSRTISIPINLRHHEISVAIHEGYVVSFIMLYVADRKLKIGWRGFAKAAIGRELEENYCPNRKIQPGKKVSM